MTDLLLSDMIWHSRGNQTDFSLNFIPLEVMQSLSGFFAEAVNALCNACESHIGGSNPPWTVGRGDDGSFGSENLLFFFHQFVLPNRSEVGAMRKIILGAGPNFANCITIYCLNIIWHSAVQLLLQWRERALIVHEKDSYGKMQSYSVFSVWSFQVWGFTASWARGLRCFLFVQWTLPLEYIHWHLGMNWGWPSVLFVRSEQIWEVAFLCMFGEWSQHTAFYLQESRDSVWVKNFGMEFVNFDISVPASNGEYLPNRANRRDKRNVAKLCVFVDFLRL